MPRYLKRGMDASAIKAADAKVRETVEGILAQVDERKDAAIRDLSKKFDNWEPKDFRLTPQEIETRHRAGAASATSTTSSSRRRRCATSRRSSATPCTTSKSRRCPASCSATSTSR